MTLNQAIYEIRLLIRRMNLYDDDKLDDRLIKFWVHNQRALWIRNEMNKSRMVDEQIMQTLPAVEMEVADRSACSHVLTGYSILQTVNDIPKVVELNNGDGIIEIGPVDRIATPFSYVTSNRARYAGSGRWNKKVIYAFRYGYKILAISKEMGSGSFLQYLRYLRVKGVFEDPEAVAAFKHVDGTSCYTEDDDYPMNSWMWNYIKDTIINANFKLLASAPTDKENDAAEILKTPEHE